MEKLYIPEICGLGLHFEFDKFRITYVIILCFLWLMSILFSTEYMKNHKNTKRFYIYTVVTFIATLGVFLGSDLFTIFIFFELMSFTSFVWVSQEETKEAIEAAKTYLAVAIIGGLAMLMGIFLLYSQLGTLEISKVMTEASKCNNKSIIFIAGVCMLVGFGAKAGAFPLHTWLPKSYMAAPTPASALLSSALSKTGLYGIIIISCNILSYDTNWGVLITVVGAITMALGAFIAIFSIDLKRTLACSSMSQIGFIIVGIGMITLMGNDNSLATYGSYLYMINHSIIKLVLFTVAGVIFMNTSDFDLNKIRGFGRKKRVIKYAFLIGALAVSGIPLFAGYASKTLLHESIVECSAGKWLTFVEYAFLISGGFTLAYMTKLFFAIFIEKNIDEALQEEYDKKTTYMNKLSTVVVALSAIILLIWGLFLHRLMEFVARMGQEFFRVKGHFHTVDYLAFNNLKGALTSITIGIVIYVLIIRKVFMRRKNGKKVYVNIWPKFLDLENLVYRPVLLKTLPLIGGICSRVLDCLVDVIVVGLRKTVYKDSPLPHERVEGNVLTDMLGGILNKLQAIRNRFWGRNNPKDKDYVHDLAVKNDMFVESTNIIQRSLSFGLMMFGIGFMFTLIYILFIH